VCVAAVHAMKRLLDSMLKVQTELLVHNPETRPVVEDVSWRGKRKSAALGSDGDEEIASSEAEGEEEAEMSEELRRRVLKRVKLEAVPGLLARRHVDFTPFR
jgi:hypothetical protein